MNGNSNPHEALAAVVLDVGRDAARRACALAASGVELGLLRSGGSRDLDSHPRPGRSCGMRRLAALTVAVLAGLAGLVLVHATTARAVRGGCSAASAPTIRSGETETIDPHLCPDNREYWAIDLKIGVQLNVDVTPAPPSVFVEPFQFDIYGPNVGTIGDFLCRSAGSGPSRVSCVIPADGRYVLVSYGAGTFTPAVTSVPAQTGRVPGACDPTGAPAAADKVTQYANGRVCSPSGSSQYWRMDLQRGDTLNVQSRQISSTGNAEPFDFRVYGPNPGALGNPLCANTGLGPTFSVTCPIRTSGRYVLEAANSGSFTPLIVRPTTTGVTAPRFVKGGGAIVVRAVIRSDAPNPAGTCVVQERSGARWAAVARTRPVRGVCRARVRARRPGTVTLRVRFNGAKGWKSSTSRPVRVRVG
jgi:hypothetical protein